jgi:hypothetical protein
MLVVMAVGAVSVVACGGGSVSIPGSPGGAATRPGATAAGGRANDGPVTVSSLGDVCVGGSRLTRAVPYAGAAPHPVMIFGPGAGDAPGAAPYTVKLLDVGRDVQSAFRALPAQTQLVGCLERVRETPTQVNCHYMTRDHVPFYRASYRLTVRAAGTGAVVDRFLIDPAASGCPTNVTVNALGPKVWSMPTTGQYVESLRRYTEWDGRGAPPSAPAGTPRPAGGTQLTAGSVRLTVPAGADARTVTVLRDYLAFWAAYEAAEETGRPVTDGLRATTDGSFLSALSQVIDNRYTSQGAVVRGVVTLTPTVRVRDAGSVTIDDCVDETGREDVRRGEPTGDIGTRIPWALSMRLRSGHFVATGFEDSPAGLCPVTR